MKIVLVVASTFVIFFSLAAFLTKFSLWPRKAVFAKPPAAGVIPANSVFHRPAHAACPTGTTLVPKYFHEEDGTTHDACFNPKGDGSIDYLNPGESCCFPVSIEPAPAAEMERKQT